MNNTASLPAPARSIAQFLKSCSTGVGQVMFQDNAMTGLIFLLGIVWGAYAEGQPYVAWGAMAGCVVSTLTGSILGFDPRDGKTGLWGFNGTLVGCGVMTFLGSTWLSWCVLILCSAMTVWVRKGFNRMMAPWGVNSLTFPFVFCTWIFVICARVFSQMPGEFMPAPVTDTALAAESMHVTFGDLVVYWLKGISQVFLINSWVTGIFFLVGLAVSSLWAAVWAGAASAIALGVIFLFGGPLSDISAGLYGFSAVLTGIALGMTFYRPNVRTAVWTVIGIIATVFVQAAMNVALAPIGLPTFTAPFCITTWLFLMPGLKLDDTNLVDHTWWNFKDE